MQRIILCPKCRVQVKRDNLGELLCPSCNARLCPKAHIFDGKICPYCGWEDPNYNLWQKAQKAKQEGPVYKTSDGTAYAKLQYTCPKCGSSVDIVHKDCPICGFLGAKYQPAKAAPTGAASAAARPATPIGSFLDKTPYASPKKRDVAPTQSPFLKEITKTERREWDFSPLKRLIRPVLASLLVVIILSSLVMGGIYITRLISQSAAEPGIRPFLPPPATSKIYTLSTTVIPETGGEIRIVPPPSSSGTFEPGSQIKLTAVPNDTCYKFSYWEGASSSSETTTITMDSDKTIVAHFTLKDTTPPTISEVKIPSYSDVSATITWETGEPATSQVEYGRTKDYGLSATSNEEPTTSHKIRLTTLEPNKTYYFMVKSADECGNEATKTGILTTLRKISVGDKVGNRAPDFQLREYQDDNPESPNNGEIVKLNQFKGKKVLLNLWDTFCGACLGEFPYIRAIYEDERWGNKNSNSEFVVLTICIDRRADRIKRLEDKYLDEMGPFTFPILIDAEENSAKDSYKALMIPKTFFIDSDGIIREIKIGRFSSKEEIEAIFESLD
ncbi:MAG: redoxin domain-containing protein [Dehalococcoidia bacterium]|nr:redoxin domain-containing protein [Dehalococcoidia bacterium]